jgi:hypothetical protein
MQITIKLVLETGYARDPHLDALEATALLAMALTKSSPTAWEHGPDIQNLGPAPMSGELYDPDGRLVGEYDIEFDDQKPPN